jgi:phospholipase A1
MDHATPQSTLGAPAALLLGLGLALIGTPLEAAPGEPADPAMNPSAIAGCAAISADRERLACYDRLSGRPQAAAPTSGPTSADRTAMSAPLAPDSAAPESAPTPDGRDDSLIDSAWGFDPDSSRYSIALYRPNYLQLASYSSRPNDAPFEVLVNALENPDAELNSTEAEFQLSFKTRLWATENRRFGVWAAYTQQSQWQVYNDAVSRPFRETNYQPELLVSYNPDLSFAGFRWGLFNFGYNHQSNGRADPISRSWDRLIAEFGVEKGDFALLIRPWIVIDDGGDDNPDITDYYGYGDITGVYKWRGHSFTLMGRGNLNTEKGAARFTWSTPRLLGPLRGYVTAFTGYGATMIDYDWKQNVFGIGVTMNDLLDRPEARE